jgi:hypothetical protein
MIVKLFQIHHIFESHKDPIIFHVVCQWVHQRAGDDLLIRSIAVMRSVNYINDNPILPGSKGYLTIDPRNRHVNLSELAGYLCMKHFARKINEIQNTFYSEVAIRFRLSAYRVTINS